ncbi:MAG: NAD(P)/FAD-dependent oxidoreductase [Candidatus Krumholzibacteriota bacterium]|nr:NAD(P)/FAD-dependent oxidoreductase [Candidatus Krumholzibacteriota bacterium]
MRADPLKTVIIVGAGPAGIAAAVQLGRYGIDTIIFEKEKAGGLAREANLVENYPGFPGGIEGSSLADLFERHLENAKARVILQEVKSLEYTGGRFVAETGNGRHEAGIAIAASGTEALFPEGIEISPGAEGSVSTGLSTLLRSTGKRIAIIGSGDAAFDYALNLSRHNEIEILMRGRDPKALPLLVERVHRQRGIKVTGEFDVEKVGKAGQALSIMARGEGSVRESIEADHLLFAIGREPATGYFGRELSRNIDLLLGERILYLAGDVRNGPFRQAAIAAGDGIRAAMEIERKIAGR